jgi:hypothetical protein
MRLRTSALLLPALVLPALLVASLAAAGPAAARSGDGVVRASGNCSGSADWKLKAKHDDGRIEVEFEIDSNRAGQTWHWRLSDDGSTVASGTRTTAGRSGSFSVERHIANRAGTDKVHLVATRGGQTCSGSVRI